MLACHTMVRWRYSHTHLYNNHFTDSIYMLHICICMCLIHYSLCTLCTSRCFSFFARSSDKNKPPIYTHCKLADVGLKSSSSLKLYPMKLFLADRLLCIWCPLRTADAASPHCSQFRLWGVVVMYAATYTNALCVASCFFCGLQPLLQPLGHVSVPIIRTVNVSATPKAWLKDGIVVEN